MTEEEYNKLLERVVKGAEYLSNPMIKEKDYEYGLRVYDTLCEEVRSFRRVETHGIDYEGSKM
ncbi:hypothetical protein [Chengkuizengella marina]|uniref:Uncharacterized protein n=1 Tax=Chengkuizengella marina TaxID=2507566 RepID=A0A6N9PZS4_9BACL|nr:hypothetical protein [Chengkuizengella marina]NBI28322.1 hypothetical protein [Chengkuizengella marina]